MNTKQHHIICILISNSQNLGQKISFTRVLVPNIKISRNEIRFVRDQNLEFAQPFYQNLQNICQHLVRQEHRKGH